MLSTFNPYIIAISLLTLIGLGSCTKHAGDEVEATVPTANLVLSAPKANQIFQITDSIPLAGIAIATAVMHGYDTYITTATDTAKLKIINVHEHNDTLSINKKFAPMAVGRYSAHVLIHLDHDGHTYHQAVAFSVE